MTNDDEDIEVAALDIAIIRTLDGTATDNQIQLVLEHVRRIIQRLAISNPDVRADAASNVVYRMLQRSSTDRNASTLASSIKFPRSYLAAIVRNEVNSIYRSKHRELSEPVDPSQLPEVQTSALDDDAIIRLIDVDATGTIIEQALRTARKRKDDTAFKVATSFLDIASREGRSPSNREIGRELSLSHVGVAKALQRFRDYLNS